MEMLILGIILGLIASPVLIGLIKAGWKKLTDEGDRY